MRRRNDDTGWSIVAVLGVVLALAVTAVGCGDPLADKLESSGRQPYSDDDPSLVDGDGTATTIAADAAADPADLARWTFVTEVNRMCEERFGALGASLRGGVSPSDALETSQRLVGTYETIAQLIEDRTPPPGDEAAVAEIVAGYRTYAALFHPMLEAGGFGSEEERATFVQQGQVAADALVAKLEGYGLGSCV